MIEHAAGFLVFFVEGYGMAEPDKVAGCGKSGNARANDSNAFFGGGKEGVKEDGVGLLLVGGTSFGGTNGNRVAEPFVAVAAGGFTGAGADASENAGKDIIAEIDAVGIVESIFCDGGEVGWNIGAGGAGFLAGDISFDPVEIFLCASVAFVNG